MNASCKHSCWPKISQPVNERSGLPSFPANCLPPVPLRRIWDIIVTLRILYQLWSLTVAEIMMMQSLIPILLLSSRPDYASSFRFPASASGRRKCRWNTKMWIPNQQEQHFRPRIPPSTISEPSNPSLPMPILGVSNIDDGDKEKTTAKKGDNKAMAFLRKVGRVGGAANMDFANAMGLDESPSGGTKSSYHEDGFKVRLSCFVWTMCWKLN